MRCRVTTPGRLGSRRHINLPGVDVNLPSLTEKDERDIRVGVEAGCDFFALSFVRASRRHPGAAGAAGPTWARKARIIAKIEDQGGLRNLDEIVKVADAVMVARGDLGIEIDYHTLPLVQTRIVDLCLTEGKPVIIATHLLESMISAPMPTRAEISDISTAVRERADAVMLSGETTTGLYPLECVEVMKNIVKTIEPTENRGIDGRNRASRAQGQDAAVGGGARAGAGQLRHRRVHAQRVPRLHAGRAAHRGRADLRLHRR